MTRAELIRRVMGAEAVEVRVVCPTPNCGLSPVRVDDFYRPSSRPGESDTFDPISGVCQGCGTRVYFMNSIPWSRVSLTPDDIRASDPRSGVFNDPSFVLPPQGKDDEPDIPE